MTLRFDQAPRRLVARERAAFLRARPPREERGAARERRCLAEKIARDALDVTVDVDERRRREIQGWRRRKTKRLRDETRDETEGSKRVS